MKNRARAAGMTVVLLVLFCRSIVFADANYQINVSSNIEYAVFTLTYSGSVTGLQITSPDGVVFDQSTCGAAYSTPTGQIKIGVRTAVAGKWKIHISGSPDNGFQIAVASDANYGSFAGDAVTSTLSPIPSPTPSPAPTSSPSPTATPVPPTPTRTATSTPIPKQTIPTETAMPTETDLPVVVITPTTESITEDTTASPDNSTSTPTSTLKVSETTIAERESWSVKPEEKKGSLSSLKLTKHNIVVALFVLVCALAAIGVLWLFLFCLKKRKQMQNRLHAEKARITAFYRLQKNKVSDILSYQKEKRDIVRKRRACERTRKKETAILVNDARVKQKMEATELAAIKTTERKEARAKKKNIVRQERLRVENERLERAQKSNEKQEKATSDQLDPKLDKRQRKTKKTAEVSFFCVLSSRVNCLANFFQNNVKRVFFKKKKARTSRYFLYHLKATIENRAVQYLSYDQLREDPKIASYELVCSASLHWSMNVESVISQIRERNENITLSVSDVIVLERDNDCCAYYIDYKNYKDCTSFAEQHKTRYADKDE